MIGLAAFDSRHFIQYSYKHFEVPFRFLLQCFGLQNAFTGLRSNLEEYREKTNDISIMKDLNIDKLHLNTPNKNILDFNLIYLENSDFDVYYLPDVPDLEEEFKSLRAKMATDSMEMFSEKKFFRKYV